MKATARLSSRTFFLLGLACISGLLMSPKWMLPIAPWIHFAVLLRFYREHNWKGFLLSIPVLTLSSFLAQVKVIPLPDSAVWVMMLVGSVIALIPYLLDRLLYRHLPTWSRK
ncbi:MAG: hypothetical protein AAF399_27550 [Bacteroidota bacterium]